MCETQWKPVKSHPSYRVSEDGEFLNTKFDRRLEPFNGSRGEPRIAFTFEGVTTIRQAARVVAEAFLEDYDPRYQVRHINGDKWDISVWNLEMTDIGAH